MDSDLLAMKERLVPELLSDIDACHDTSSDDMNEDVDSIFICGHITLSTLNELAELTGREHFRKGK